MAVAAKKKPLIAEVKKLVDECGVRIKKRLAFAVKWLNWSAATENKRKQVLAAMKKKPAEKEKLAAAFMKNVFWPEYILLVSEEATLRERLATSVKKVETFLSKNKKSLNPKGQAPLKAAVTNLKDDLKQMQTWLKAKSL